MSSQQCCQSLEHSLWWITRIFYKWHRVLQAEYSASPENYRMQYKICRSKNLSSMTSGTTGKLFDGSLLSLTYQACGRKCLSSNDIGIILFSRLCFTASYSLIRKQVMFAPHPLQYLTCVGFLNFNLKSGSFAFLHTAHTFFTGGEKMQYTWCICPRIPRGIGLPGPELPPNTSTTYHSLRCGTFHAANWCCSPGCPCTSWNRILF